MKKFYPIQLILNLFIITAILILFINPSACKNISGESTFFDALLEVGGFIWPRVYSLAKTLFIPVIMIDLSCLLFTHDEKAISIGKNILKITCISMLCMIILNFFFSRTGDGNYFLEIFKDLETSRKEP